MATQASRFIGSIPEHYDRGLGPHLFQDYAGDLARRVAELAPTAVLELAAGTGILSRRLRDALAEDCRLLASDLNPPMLEVARAKFQSGEGVDFRQADAMSLAFGDASFDVVACQFGVMFFPDKQKSYAEAHRVLRDQGSYLFSVWDSWAANPFAQITHEALKSFFPGNPPGFYRVPFEYCDVEEIRGQLLQAGFAEVTTHTLPLRSPIRSARTFARGLVFGNPCLEEITTRGGEPGRVCAAVEKAIREQLGAEMPLQALVVHARKE